MLLGKRSRHPMKRTTSMTGITVDVSNVDDDVQQPSKIMSDPHPHMHNPLHEFPNANFAGYDPRFLAMVSPRNPLSQSAVAAVPGRSGSTSTNNHVVDSTAPFLRSCCLCNRRLAPGRDIYMYRGDTAFCSLECREQQMKQDERKERLKNVVEDRHGHASSTSSNSKPSTKTESAAAA